MRCCLAAWCNEGTSSPSAPSSSTSAIDDSSGGRNSAADPALDYFRQAIEKEPDYALAHAALAEAYTTQAILRGSNREEVVEEARRAVRRALEIDPDLAEGYTAQALVKATFDWDWQGAEADFERAVQLSPGNAVVQLEYGKFLTSLGRLEAGLGRSLKAQELDPLSTGPAHDVAINYLAAHDYEKAALNFRRAIELHPNWTWGHVKLALTLARAGKCAEALAEAELSTYDFIGMGNPLGHAWLGYIYGHCGETERARTVLVELQELSQQRYVDPGVFPAVYIGLGDMDRAFEWMEKAYEDRSPSLVYTRLIPLLFLDELEADPRFQELLRRLDLL